MKTLCCALSVFILGSAISAQQDHDTKPAHSPRQATVRDVWSMGIYTGSSPFRLSEPPNVRNPVIAPEDVTDFRVNIVAHPFMIIIGSRYYPFFTAKNDVSGEVSGIGLAESGNGTDWQYRRTVLKEPFVLSYPYVFKYQNDYYMIPVSRS